MKYKLKKDLPGYPAGTVFEQNEELDSGLAPGWQLDNIVHDHVGVAISAILGEYHDNPDWFEPLPDTPKRWRAEDGGEYYCFDLDMPEHWLGLFERLEDDNQLDYNNHNYFQTQKQAEAAAKAIGELLKYIHGETEIATVADAVFAARALVVGGGE